jgi:ribosomal protein S18 acetylase RimI-like enzyme
MLNLEIQQAAPDDAENVVELLRRSFRPEDLGLTIYGCHGIEAYLRLEFAQPREFSTSTYLVARIAGQLAGFVEFRLLDGGPHVNYIAIDSAWQKIGIGSELLSAALKTRGTNSSPRLTLDVFEHNQTALNWYMAKGLRALRRTAFWTVALPPGEIESHWRVAGFALSEVTHSVLGFSSFNLIGPGRTFSVGRLARRWFRITEREFLHCRPALVALHCIEPGREVLFVGEEEAIPPDLRTYCSPILWSLQMELPL